MKYHVRSFVSVAVTVTAALLAASATTSLAQYSDAINVNFSDAGNGDVSGSLEGVPGYRSTSNWNNNKIQVIVGNPWRRGTTTDNWESPETVRTANGVTVTVTGSPAFAVSFYVSGGLGGVQAGASLGSCGGGANTLLAWGFQAHPNGQYAGTTLEWANVPFSIYEVWWLAGDKGVFADCSWHKVGTYVQVHGGNAGISFNPQATDHNDAYVAAVQILELPVIDNANNASNVTENSAFINGTLLFTSSTPSTVWVYWGTNDGDTVASSWSNSCYFGTNTSACPVPYTTNVSLPASNTVYYYRYCAVTAGSTNWAGSTAIFINDAVTLVGIDTNASETTKDSLTFRVYRPPATTNVPIQVNYSVTGTAVSGLDYEVLPGYVTIEAGETNADITVVPRDNYSLVHTNRTVLIAIAEGGYRIGSPSSATGFIADDDVLAGWGYRMKVVFGYDKDEILTNFPALAVLGPQLPGFAYSQFASTNGGDLRFVNSNLTSYLNYEAEYWDESTNVCVWVQVPEFCSNCYVWAYWSNPDATTAPFYTTNAATWKSGFRAVWHMNELNARDATLRGHGGAAQGAPVTNTSSVIGRCVEFNGASQYISVPTSTDFLFSSNDFSFSAWVNTSGTNGIQGIFGNYNNCFSFGLNGGNLSVDPGQWPGSPAVGTNGWHLASATRQGTDLRLYVDGVLQQTTATGSNINTSGNSLEIGTGGPNRHGWFGGMIDEPRIESVKRSSNWVWACWMNQGSNSIYFNGYAPVEARGTVFLIR